MKAWLLVGAVIACTVGSDLLQSYAMKRQGEVTDFRPTGIARLLSTLAHNRHIIMSVVLMAVSFFAFLSLVSIADLSFAVPATSGSVAVSVVCARFVLNEKVNASRWAGAALVACGVALLAA
jgi:drug/metabolite transporter (DMT)-like permease